MKFISVRDFRNRSAQIWKELPAFREMVITSNGRPIAILSAVGESDLEEALSALRRARATEAVVQLQSRSLAQGTDKISPDDINTEIAKDKVLRWPHCLWPKACLIAMTSHLWRWLLPARPVAW